jgi:polyhydroxybutyrate depolymerase
LGCFGEGFPDFAAAANPARDRNMNLRNLWVLVAGIVAGLFLPALFGLEPSAKAILGRITIQSGGMPRTALFVEHERLKKARRPVVIVLHSGKGNGGRLRRHLGLGEAARSSGAVMIYPESVAGAWGDSPGPATEKDSQFIIDLANKLVADGVADRRRIYIVGASSGGLFAIRLACEHSEIFSGIVAILAGMPADLKQTCRPARPIRFMLIAGTADPFVPFHGGLATLPGNKVALLSADETLAVFAKANGCSDGKTTTAFPDRDPKDGTRAFLEKLKGCKAPVELVRIEGGGHIIPGRWASGARSGTAGLHNNDIDTATLIWDFFRRAGTDR